MDQVKVVLRVMGKHHFWIVSGVVTILAIVFYATASGNLASRYEEGVARIEGKRSAAEQIGSGGPPDNQKVIDAFREDVKAAKEDVLKAWEFLYSLQKEKNPWPEELGKNFRLMINSLKQEEEIPYRYREIYRDFINNHFPSLWDIVDVRREVLLDQDRNVVHTIFDFGNPNPWGSFQGGVDAGLYKREVVGKVVWSAPEVLALGRDWMSTPGTRQVRLAQEDLWVYEALLRIVRNTNEGATSYHNAAIKRIDAMHIGQAGSAAFASTQFSPYGSYGGYGGYGGGDDDDDYGDDDDDDDYGGGGGGYYATTGMTSDDALLQGRYVDQNGQPLPANSNPFAEFKMMAVRLILLMDQRKIPDLLANCANSSMPVEVRRVTIRPGQGPALDLGSMIAAAAPVYSGDDDDDDDYGDDDDDDDYGSYSSRGAGTTTQMVAGGVLPDSIDLPVEIRGVIFIFNLPDRDKLGTGEQPDEATPLVPQRAPEVASPDAAPVPGAETEGGAAPPPAAGGAGAPPAGGATAPAPPAAGPGT